MDDPKGCTAESRLPAGPGSEVDLFSGTPLPMTLTVDTGSYLNAVHALRAKLEAAFKSTTPRSGEKFEIAVFGHGGRDTNCCLALVEAVAGHEVLRNNVKITHCSCSWADDEWEPMMASYLRHLETSDQIAKTSVDFHVLKYHEEVGVLVDRVRSHVGGKDCIVQCEQGIDMFVEPITAEWLQDNFEDFTVHDACLTCAEQAGVPALMIQTNADLDSARGIDYDDISSHVFQGQLQVGGTFVIDIEWTKAVSGVDSVKDLIGVALYLSMARPKKAAFLHVLDIEESDFESLPGFYAAYIAYSASQTDAQVPVAGVLEVIFCLMQRGHSLPFRVLAQPPAPQWCIAQFMQPSDAKNGCLRVASQFRNAGMDSAPTFATYWSRWMFARRSRRLRRNDVSAKRWRNLVPAFRKQLEEAKLAVEEVKRSCADFALWPADSPDFFEHALGRMGNMVKASFKDWHAMQAKAKKGQEDYGELSPLWLFCQTNYKMFLDFACRMLESPLGVDGEYTQIASGIIGAAESSSTLRPYCKLFAQALVEEWQASKSLKRKSP